MLHHLTCNLAGACRYAKLKGNDYLVVPMVMLMEGVHAGSRGPLYYPEAELRKTPAVWNTKPIVVYHPEINGQGVSACDPEVLEASSVGMIMNTKFKKAKGKDAVGKLHAEAWLEVSRLETIDNRILKSIEEEKIMELSTGLYTDDDDVEGEWNGERYIGVARNYRPDHLAILPDRVGACSVADGAGLLRLNAAHTKTVKSASQKKIAATLLQAYDAAGILVNGMAFGEITSLLNDEIRRLHRTDDKDWVWVEDVFDDHVVFSKETNNDRKLLKQSYTLTNDRVTLNGDPVEVRRRTEYVALTASVPKINEDVKEQTVQKKEVVDALIANKLTAWTDEDREYLMSLEDDKLQKFSPVAPKANEGTPPTAAPATPAPAAQPAEAPKPVTFNEYIQAAPAEWRDVMVDAVATYNEKKTKLVQEILANERNGFTEQELLAKSPRELDNLAALARRPAAPAATLPVGIGLPNYAGAAAPVGNTATAVEEPLIAPKLNYETAK